MYIGTTEQDNNKLLAIVIYKNIFPRDFSDLQMNKGFVYSVFFRKAEYIADEEERIEAAIRKYTNDLEAIDKEILKDKSELELVYREGKYHQYGLSNRDLLTEYKIEKEDRMRVIENKTSDRISAFQSEIEKHRQEKSALYEKSSAKSLHGIILSRFLPLNISEQIRKCTPNSRMLSIIVTLIC